MTIEFATINDVVNGITIAGLSASRIIFNRANGDLFYNADGSSGSMVETVLSDTFPFSCIR